MTDFPRSAPSRRKLRRMNPRQRKKHHAAQWQELGFQVQLAMRPGMGGGEADALIDGLIAVIEARRLVMGGGGGALFFEGFICAAGRGSATDADRQVVQDWLQGRPEVEQVEIGPLADAWYG